MSAIKIHVLHTGLVKVDTGLPFHDLSRNPLAFTGLFRSHIHQITLPVSSYLIEHPNGLVLIDTGWHERVRQSQWQELGLQTQINKAYLPAGWSVREQLARLGYQPSDIDYLVLSHLHSDHASGLPLVKDAQHILVSQPEWQAAQHDKLRYIPKMWQGVNVQTYDFSASKLGPFHQSFDLFGDGSLQFIYVPGHSRGLAATLVQGASGQQVLLASDTGYAQTSIDHLYTPGIVINRAQALQSIAWVQQAASEPQVIETLTNHDPAIRPHTITLA
ncbi:N-acyl homoserine lactonase family protein [Lactiplantibacillus daowaiensis]|uniref:N-acyl homoserine lactonase family protein n=1 Tax=Lactiplantibacillus daowaiensis TaxID=2559918 RepID=A0ABW1S293_9LACO|nr:N-acyl homoserine lactonase family protein [Lactiplantibacillus daowaiensis]